MRSARVTPGLLAVCMRDLVEGIESTDSDAALSVIAEFVIWGRKYFRSQFK